MNNIKGCLLAGSPATTLLFNVDVIKIEKHSFADSIRIDVRVIVRHMSLLAQNKPLTFDII